MSDHDRRAPIGPLTIKLHPADNVVVARADLLPGTGLPGTNVVCRTHIPAGHKVAVAPVATDQAVRNFDRDYAFGANAKPTAYLPEAERATFQGIKRADGRVATRNYIGVLTT